MTNRPFCGVFYAINGRGLGHITRQTNIARDLRLLLSRLQIPDRLEVLTTSDAPQVAREFLVTKIPSKTTINKMGFSPRKFAAQARNLIGNFLSAVQPDVLVVDTDPRGSFAEIAFVRGFAKNLVFVDRHKDESVTQQASYRANLAIYDLIVVPEDSTCLDTANPRVQVTGKIQAFLPERALSRAAVRAHYGLRPGERLLYLSAGGGGDPQAGECLERAIDALAAVPDSLVVVGYGPLFEGRMCCGRRNVLPMQSCDMAAQFAGFDMAVSAAGYNSHEELLAACVPTLFHAQTKGMDRQDLRIQASLASGWCGAIESWEPGELRRQITRFLDHQAGEIRQRLLQRALPQGNLKSARCILRLVLGKAPFNVPAETVDRAAQDVLTAREAARAALFGEDCS